MRIKVRFIRFYFAFQQTCIIFAPNQNILIMIFYLSCTGNTKWAAEAISKATGERMINMAETESGETSYTLDGDERIGFCFPVHGWRPPKIVRDFVRRLEISGADGHYCYALCTAGDTIGETIDIMRADLKARGIRLDGAFSLLMPESYVGLPFMDVDKPENEKRKKDKAATKLKKAIEAITAKRQGTEDLDIGHWPRINSRLIGGVFTNYMITDKPFRVTADKCVKCGACVKACPIGNVTPDEHGKPTWNLDGSCLACFSCYHHCPTHAIEYGNRTKHKGQYFYK